MGAQIVVHVPAPAGERWKVTDVIARSDVAVAESATEPFSWGPGSASDTATLLKTVDDAKVVDA